MNLMAEHIRAVFKLAFAAIARHWRVLAFVVLLSILLVGLALTLLKFPDLRFPAVLVAISLFLIGLLWRLPIHQVRSIGPDPKDRFDRENEARKTLSQVLGGIALLAGFYSAWQNLRVGQESQITDRFTKAIAELGDSKPEIQLGGIYALERISNDSPKDHWSIMEVLTGYVREHAEISPEAQEPCDEDSDLTITRPTTNIQAILTIIGRRTLTYQNGEDQRLDLHDTDLRGTKLVMADLRGANLVGADFTKASLYRANLSKADLTEAKLTAADFEEVNLIGADLRGAEVNCRATLSGATLSGALLVGANLRKANLNGASLGKANVSATKLIDADLTYAYLKETNLSEADLTGADLSGADLTEAKGLLPAQLESAKGNALTKLPPGLARPKAWQ